SASRCTNSRWWRRPCCSEATRASGSRTISTWPGASWRRAMPRWWRKPRRSSRSWATRWPRRPTRGKFSGGTCSRPCPRHSSFRPDRVRRRDDGGQRMFVERHDAGVLFADQPRLGAGIVVEPRLVGLFQKPRQLFERPGVALENLVLGDRVAAFLHPQAHAFDVALGRVEQHVDEADLEAQRLGLLAPPPALQRGEDGFHADPL